MQAHVICCNDSQEFVIIDDGSASQEEVQAKVGAKLDALKKAYFDRNRHAFGSCFSESEEIRVKHAAEAWERYSKQCYWHVHTVGAER